MQRVDCAVCIVRPSPHLWEIEDATTLVAPAACLIHARELLALQGVRVEQPKDREELLRAHLEWLNSKLPKTAPASPQAEPRPANGASRTGDP